MKKMYLFLLIGLLSLSVAQAETFVNSFGNFDTNQANGWGSRFIPGAGNITPDGFGVPQTVYLQSWTYAKSSSGGGMTAGPVYLVIFTELNPNLMNADNLVGVSSTTVNMMALPTVLPGSLCTWQFNNIALDKDTEYALMFSSTPDHTGIRMSQGLELQTGNPSPAISFIRVDNVANDWDPHFSAVYSNGLEPMLVSPANNADAVVTQPTLQWQAPASGQPDSFVLVYAADPNLDEQGIEVPLDAQTTSYTFAANLAFETEYFWTVAAVYGTARDYSLTYSFTTVPPTPVITANPIPATIAAGSNYTFTVDGLNQTAYQWMKNGVAIQGATEPSLTISNASIADEAFYSALLINDAAPQGVETTTAGLWIKRLVATFDFEGNLLDSTGDWNDGIMVDPNQIRNEPDITFDTEDFISGSQSIVFGGQQGYVKVPASQDIVNFFMLGHTVSCWVKPSEPVATGWQLAVSTVSGGSVDGGGFGLGLANGNPVTNMRGTGDVFGGASKTVDGWRFVVSQFDPEANKFRLYWVQAGANDAPAQLRTAEIDASARRWTVQPILFGTEVMSQQNPETGVITGYNATLSGKLDDVRIWNYAISQAEVAQLYADVAGENLCLGTVEYDLNGDCIVNLEDFAMFASQWMLSNLVTPEN